MLNQLRLVFSVIKSIFVFSAIIYENSSKMITESVKMPLNFETVQNSKRQHTKSEMWLLERIVR